MTKRKRNIIIIAAVAVVLAAAAAVAIFISSSNARRYQNYYEDALEYYSIGDYASAASYLENAVDLKSTDEAVLLLADCYVSGGDTARAVTLLEQYSDSSAVARRLRELRGAPADESEDITIGGETFSPDTENIGLPAKNLTSADLAPLADLAGLRSATLSDNAIDDISFLRALTGLEVLDLSGNSISDLAPLSGLTSLRTLYLDNNVGITDFEPLHTLRRLSTLSIKGIEITENQLAELQEALPACNIHCEKALEDIEEITLGGVTFTSDVTELDLSNKSITDITDLTKCEDLKRLNLSGNSITDITALMDIPGLQWLSLRGNKISDLRPLMGLTRLTYLDVQNNSIKSLSSVSSLAGLTNLYAGQNELSSFAPIAQCAALTELGLEGTGMTDADLAAVSRLTHLTRLFAENNPELSYSGVEDFKKALPDCRITHSELLDTFLLGTTAFPANAAEISAASLGLTDITALEKLTACEVLILRDNKIADISVIANLTTLKALDLSENEITDIAALERLTALETLDLEGNDITDFTPLHALTGLRELYISSAAASAGEINALYAALPGCLISVDGQTP